MSRRAPYIILAPQYRDNSAGIRMLYALRDHLEARGYAATISDGTVAPAHAVVVYPETVDGNPLGGETVVRYLLNHPGRYGTPMNAGPSDLLFTCNAGALRKYVPSDDRVLCVPILEPFFRDEKLPRAGGCFYVGKGAALPLLPITDGLTEIIGMTRAQVARTLQTAEVLYTYDNFSMILHEAAACGCPVVVIGAAVREPTYHEHIRDFPAQLDAFIRITQEAAARVPVLSFGVLVNDIVRLDMVLRRSQVAGNMHFVKEPETATKGLNVLLDRLEAEGADVAVLCHQDMYFRQGWLPQVRDQLALLPDSWVVAGPIGKAMDGLICGRFWDHRIPDRIDSSDVHTFPHPACCFDECVILVNLKSGFRFDEALDGFDLYGTLAVLQAWEMGGTAWIIDAFCEHHCMRPFSWFPDERFQRNFKWLHDRFHTAQKIDTTVLGVPDDARIFATSA